MSFFRAVIYLLTQRRVYPYVKGTKGLLFHLDNQIEVVL